MNADELTAGIAEDAEVGGDAISLPLNDDEK